MRMPRSTALHMSYTVRAATDTAVRASISTPVLAEVRAVAVISIRLWAWSSSKSTFTWFRGKGWQRGINSEVLLAPMMPASWAMVSTSPFFIKPS